jgi:hypothetical protein
MKKLSLLAITIVGMTLLGVSAYALDITVDGNVNDWGIQVKNNNASNWNTSAEDVVSVTEDYNDTDTSGRIFPGWGGQKYDAEGLYVTYDTDYLYLLIVTGLKPTGWGESLAGPGNKTILPGDVAIAFDQDITQAEFGLETTGSNAGGLYQVSKWGSSPYNWQADGSYKTKYDQDGNGYGSITDPTEIQGGTLLGTNSLVYQQIAGASQHYAIETAIDLSLFGDYWKTGDTFSLHWTMTCGNDAIDVKNVTITPEPGTLLLVGVGLLGGFGIIRKRLF